MNKIVPKPTNVSEPYWQGCRDHQLRLQHCRACKTVQFYPRLQCNACQQQDLEWIDASGNGRIASFTVVRRGISDAYPAPYVVALVDLTEGPRMMTHLVGCEPDELTIGDTVSVKFEAWSDEFSMPVFHLSSAQATL